MDWKNGHKQNCVKKLTASETEVLHQQALSDKDALLGVQYNDAELIALTEDPTHEARYPEVDCDAYVWREDTLYCKLLSGASGGFGLLLDQLDELYPDGNFKETLRLGKAVSEVSTRFYGSAQYLIHKIQSVPGFDFEAVQPDDDLAVLATQLKKLFGYGLVGDLIEGRSLRELGRLDEAKKLLLASVKKSQAMPEAIRETYKQNMEDIQSALDITLDRLR